MARIVKTQHNRCEWCKGTGKKPPFTITEKTASLFFGNIVLVDQLEKYTDAEIAKIAVDEIWAHFKIGSREQEIVSTMVDRIKRSNQGPLTGWSDPENLCDSED